MSAQPDVKGWCPGAYKPMISGDGLIVRVRPFYGRLDAEQMLGLCRAAQAYGNGFIDLTNRANLQIRGVSEADYTALLAALKGLGLLDDTPETEARRNILISPFWSDGDATYRFTQDLMQTLDALPTLPAKFGFAVDTGARPLLRGASADIRVERSPNGFIVRADGAQGGKAVIQTEVIGAIAELALWFATYRAPDERRMAQVIKRMDLPHHWTATAPIPTGPLPVPGQHALGAIVGAAFGQMDAGALSRVISTSGAKALRVTPWRLFLLEGAEAVQGDGFVFTADDPLLNVDACPGAPFCASASIETRALARSLAGKGAGSLHVSGCAKGCARKQSADVTLVGKDGRFDLVRKGHAWDAPEKSGLRPQDLLAEVKCHP